jgi:hypothetical protein
VQPSRTHRLAQGVSLDVQSIGDLGCLQAFVEQLLGLLQYRRGQHRRPAPPGWDVEPFRSLLTVTLHRALEADLRYPEGAHDVRLLGIAVDAELGGDHAKGGHVLFIVDEHRHGAVEVGYAPILFAESEHGGDVGNTRGENRQLDLGHRLATIRQGKSQSSAHRRAP